MACKMHNNIESWVALVAKTKHTPPRPVSTRFAGPVVLGPPVSAGNRHWWAPSTFHPLLSLRPGQSQRQTVRRSMSHSSALLDDDLAFFHHHRETLWPRR